MTPADKVEPVFAGIQPDDCTSIALMKTEGMTESATGDRHFEQEGLRALFRA